MLFAAKIIFVIHRQYLIVWYDVFELVVADGYWYIS